MSHMTPSIRELRNFPDPSPFNGHESHTRLAVGINPASDTLYFNMWYRRMLAGKAVYFPRRQRFSIVLRDDGWVINALTRRYNKFLRSILGPTRFPRVERRTGLHDDTHQIWTSANNTLTLTPINQFIMNANDNVAHRLSEIYERLLIEIGEDE